MSELPDGWVRTTLGAVCSHPQYGFTTSSSQTGSIKFLRTTDISGGKICWETVPFCENNPPAVGKYKISKRDILVSRAGSVGLSVFIDQNPPSDSVFASYLIRFNVRSEIEARYIAYFLKSNEYWSFISDSAAGIAVPNVNARKLAELPIPLAPLNEQKRIVAKLDELLPKVEACKQRLEKIPLILKRFRQSVLAAAVSGKLTEEWRRQHQVAGADALLEAFEMRRGKRKVSKGKIPEDWDIPNGWRWASLDQICEVITDGDHQPPPQTDEGVPFIVISNIRSGRVDLSNTRFVDEEYYKKLDDKRRPRGGDILYSVVGSFGIPAPVETNDCFVFQRHIALFRAYKEIDKKFLLTLLQSGLVFNQARAVATGSAQLTVPITGLRAIMIPLPPTEEQKAITDAVSAKLTTYDNLINKVQLAERFVDRTGGSLLASAFSGGLVIQDPTDEPASTLLERLKALSATSTNGSKAKRSRKTKDQNASASA